MTEPRKKKPRRASDRWLPKLLIVSTLVNLLCVGLLTVGSVGIISNKQALERAEEALERIDTEAVERKDADCVKDERDYFAKVNQLTTSRMWGCRSRTRWCRSGRPASERPGVGRHFAAWTPAFAPSSSPW
jgi:hypothetical protein